MERLRFVVFVLACVAAPAPAFPAVVPAAAFVTSETTEKATNSASTTLPTPAQQQPTSNRVFHSARLQHPEVNKRVYIRSKKSPSTAGCHTVAGPFKQPRVICNDAVFLPPQMRSGRSLDQNFGSFGEVSPYLTKERFRYPGFNSGSRMNTFFGQNEGELQYDANRVPQLMLNQPNFNFRSFSNEGLSRSGCQNNAARTFGLQNQESSMYSNRMSPAAINNVNLVDAAEAMVAERKAEIEAEKSQKNYQYAMSRTAPAEMNYPQIPTINNVVPTMTLPTGQQFRSNSRVSAFPKVGGSPCGGIPLLLSCSPNIIRGSLISAGQKYGNLNGLGGFGLGGYGVGELNFGGGLGFNNAYGYQPYGQPYGYQSYGYQPYGIQPYSLEIDKNFQESSSVTIDHESGIKPSAGTPDFPNKDSAASDHLSPDNEIKNFDSTTNNPTVQ